MKLLTLIFAVVLGAVALPSSGLAAENPVESRAPQLSNLEIVKLMVGYDNGKLPPSGDPKQAVQGLELGLDKYFEEDAITQFNAPPGMPIYGKEWRGKQEMIEGVARELELLSWDYDGPVQIIDGGDTIVLLGRQNVTIKSSGKVIRSTMFAWAYDFRNGRVWRTRCIQDFSDTGLGAAFKH